MHYMLTSKFGRRVLLLMLAMALALGLAPRYAWAGFTPTIASQEAKGDVDMDRIRSYLESKKVSETLVALGYSETEIEERLLQLTPEEISALAGELDNAMVPNGGAAGVAIGVVVVILVVLGILSLMGKRVTVSS
ncbi:MAG: PA2779 family protein [Deltaproteobacteria bacterium]|jgi:hypothetical protein|nr:PA2779 family protein [Deltaproteobacteria bacterium]